MKAENDTVEVLGIDPAPSKQTVVWLDSGPPRRMGPGDLRGFLEGRLASSARLLVTWDSPLAFDSALSFSDRPVDRAVRRWVRQQLGDRRIEAKAVSVRPFSGCPHWTVSCHVLGLPFGSRLGNLQPCNGAFALPSAGEGMVVETHPAVALAMWWIDLGLTEPFPRYKGFKGNADVCASIASTLGFPKAAGIDDDVLDAYVGWRLGVDFVQGKAVLLGTAQAGNYLVPDGPSARAARAALTPVDPPRHRLVS